MPLPKVFETSDGHATAPTPKIINNPFPHTPPPQQTLMSNIYSYNLTPFFPPYRTSLLMQTFNEVFSIAKVHFWIP
jgi:hypothetical protein